jgi:hypothetical protein
MSHQHHKNCGHEHHEAISRRGAARVALNFLLAGGATALALMLPTRQAKAGYGACEFNGCPCLGFVGNGENCLNCGHLYTYHAN